VLTTSRANLRLTSFCASVRNPSSSQALIFPEGQDVAFIDEVLKRGPPSALDQAFERIRKRRIRKTEVVGIHGLLFYDLAQKKPYYPTRRDEEAVNPDGSRLR
jgi:hypothetical protein